MQDYHVHLKVETEETVLVKADDPADAYRQVTQGKGQVLVVNRGGERLVKTVLAVPRPKVKE